MAKKDTGLKSTLSLGAKVPIKKSTVDVERTEEAVKKLHSEDLDKRKVVKKEGKWVRMSVDFPEEEFIKFKMKLLSEGRSREGQNVVRELVRSHYLQDK